jgi:hypothetical protein
MNNINLDKLTIVILSRDRDIHLVETIKYYKKYQIKLLVLHKSKTSILSNVKYKKLKYIRIDKSFASRCLIACEFLDTPYAILSTDDERYLPSTLVRMISTLKDNKKIHSVGGQAIAFFTYANLLCGQRLYPYLKSYQNRNKKLKQRLIKHFEVANGNITFSSMYRMYRVKDFKEMLKLFALGDGVSTALITEVTSELFSLSRGQIYYLNDLLWIRNFMVEPINKSDWSRDTTFNNWWNDPIYNVEKSKWLDNIKMHLPHEEVNLILEFIIRNRKNEIYIKSRSRININVKFKYLIRKYFFSNTLPKQISKVLDELTYNNIKFSKKELIYALDNMYLPFTKN